jgi:hypothetical protein
LDPPVEIREFLWRLLKQASLQVEPRRLELHLQQVAELYLSCQLTRKLRMNLAPQIQLAKDLELPPEPLFALGHFEGQRCPPHLVAELQPVGEKHLAQE